MSWLADALGMPIVTLGRYLAGENPGSVDPSRDALRVAKGCGPSIALYGTEAVPVVVGASLARIELAAIDVSMASLCTLYVQIQSPSADVTACQIGVALEASHDGVTFYPAPLIGTVDAGTTIFPTVAGTGGPPATNGGFVNAAETANRALYYDMVYLPVAAASLVTAGAAIAAMRAIPFNVRPYRSIRGILVPLYATSGDVPLCSVVANLAT